MSCCGGNCGCGSDCKCGSGCGGCKMYPDLCSYSETAETNVKTQVLGVASQKTEFENERSGKGEAGAGDGCHCGPNCQCNPCTCN